MQTNHFHSIYTRHNTWFKCLVFILIFFKYSIWFIVNVVQWVAPRLRQSCNDRKEKIRLISRQNYNLKPVLISAIPMNCMKYIHHIHMIINKTSFSNKFQCIKSILFITSILSFEHSSVLLFCLELWRFESSFGAKYEIEQISCYYRNNLAIWT